MRRSRWRVAGCPDVPDDVSTTHGHPFLEPLGVVVEVSIVVAVRALRVELVNRQAAGFAQEEFLNDAVVYGYDWRSAGRQNIGRLMEFAPGPGLPECVLNI